MMAGWRADGRRGSSSAASRARRRALVACGVLVDGAARCRLDGRGRGKVSGAASPALGAASRQWCSERARARSSACARRGDRESEGEREGREKESRERKREVNRV